MEKLTILKGITLSFVIGALSWALHSCSSAPTLPATAISTDDPWAGNPWPSILTPVLNDPAKSIGGYAAGCLVGAVSLPPDGPGYQLMRLSRRRFYGHPRLIEFLQALGKKVALHNLNPILIGDLAQARGGPTNSNHVSHQNGLDVDIWFWQWEEAKNRSLTLDERERVDAPSMILRDQETLDPLFWSAHQAEILKWITEDVSVDRIFVNPAIKRHLCRKTPPGESQWLQKLRPWGGHDDHFHVRLKCPEHQKGCAAQPPVPEGPGCDSSLDWWFSEEHKKEVAEAPPFKFKMPKLPDECESVLHF